MKQGDIVTIEGEKVEVVETSHSAFACTLCIFKDKPRLFCSKIIQAKEITCVTNDEHYYYFVEPKEDKKHKV